MNNNELENIDNTLTTNKPRREFLRRGVLAGTLAGIAGLSLVTSCKEGIGKGGISPAEDLMREHGVLNRIIMIYDHCMAKLVKKEEFPLGALTDSASLIRSFIEDYHEKLEEKYIFPRFINANNHVDIIQTLYVQHHAGRILTDQLLSLGNANSLKDPDSTLKLINLIDTFNRMYRPHEACEDTVIFPDLRTIVSRNEFDSMGEDFEKQEHKLFGDDGYESIVGKVADIEKKLGIYDISAFTPAV